MPAPNVPSCSDTDRPQKRAIVTVFSGVWSSAVKNRGGSEAQPGIVRGYWLVDEQEGTVLRVLVAEDWKRLEAEMEVFTMDTLAENGEWKCVVSNLDDGTGTPTLPLLVTTGPGTVARVATLAGRGDEQARRYHHERILPALRAEAGYRGGLWLVDEASGTRHNFSFWNNERALRAATERIYASYRTAGRVNPVEEEAIYQVVDVI